MIAVRFGALLLLALFATAQQNSIPRVKASVPEPKLPVVSYDACPFEGCIFREWTVTKRSTIYSTWQDHRRVLGRLTKGERVQGLTGVYVTREPDRFLVKRAISYLSLRSGDEILQYMESGEGYADLWANGVWHKDFDWGQTDGSVVTLTDGGFTSPLVLGDNVTLVRHGIKEWWAQVRTANGKTGWVLVQDNFSHMDRFGDTEDRNVQ